MRKFFTYLMLAILMASPVLAQYGPKEFTARDADSFTVSSATADSIAVGVSGNYLADFTYAILAGHFVVNGDSTAVTYVHVDGKRYTTKYYAGQAVYLDEFMETELSAIYFICLGSTGATISFFVVGR